MVKWQFRGPELYKKRSQTDLNWLKSYLYTKKMTINCSEIIAPYPCCRPYPRCLKNRLRSIIWLPEEAQFNNGLRAIWPSAGNLSNIKTYVLLPENWERGCHRDQFWDLCCFLYSWTIYILWITKWISFYTLTILHLPVHYVHLLMVPKMMLDMFRHRLILNYWKFLIG